MFDGYNYSVKPFIFDWLYSTHPSASKWGRIWTSQIWVFILWLNIFKYNDKLHKFTTTHACSEMNKIIKATEISLDYDFELVKNFMVSRILIWFYIGFKLWLNRVSWLTGSRIQIFWKISPLSRAYCNFFQKSLSLFPLAFVAINS